LIHGAGKDPGEWITLLLIRFNSGVVERVRGFYAAKVKVPTSRKTSEKWGTQLAGALWFIIKNSPYYSGVIRP
jgi:hypothetical protein